MSMGLRGNSWSKFLELVELVKEVLWKPAWKWYQWLNKSLPILMLVRITLALSTATATKSSLLLCKRAQSLHWDMEWSLCPVSSKPRACSVCKPGLPQAGDSTPWKEWKWHYLANAARETPCLSPPKCARHRFVPCSPKGWDSGMPSPPNKHCLFEWVPNPRGELTSLTYLVILNTSI